MSDLRRTPPADDVRYGRRWCGYRNEWTWRERGENPETCWGERGGHTRACPGPHSSTPPADVCPDCGGAGKRLTKWAFIRPKPADAQDTKPCPTCGAEE